MLLVSTQKVDMMKNLDYLILIINWSIYFNGSEMPLKFRNFFFFNKRKSLFSEIK